MASVNWDHLRCFAAVARKGNLTAAARDLNISAATLGRRIDALESTLGLKVLARRPSGATVTPHGEAILNLIRPGGEYLDQIARLAQTLRQTSESPPVRISSTEPIISDVLVPALPAFFEANPDIRLELETSLEVSNLHIGEADIAVRMFEPQSDTLIARKLPSIRLQLYCSADYLAGRNPKNLRLTEERLVWYDKAYGDIAENVWVKERGLVDQIGMRSGSVRALQRAAEAGVGIAPIPAFLAARTNLIPVPSPPLPIRQAWIAFHKDARSIAHQKRVRNWIRSACNVFKEGDG